MLFCGCHTSNKNLRRTTNAHLRRLNCTSTHTMNTNITHTSLVMPKGGKRVTNGMALIGLLFSFRMGIFGMLSQYAEIMPFEFTRGQNERKERMKRQHSAQLSPIQSTSVVLSRKCQRYGAYLLVYKNMHTRFGVHAVYGFVFPYRIEWIKAALLVSFCCTHSNSWTMANSLVYKCIDCGIV